MQQDYYKILGVPPDATADTIRTRYRIIIQLLNASPGRAKEFASLSVINEAFRVLSNSVERGYYDRARQYEEASPVAAPVEQSVAPEPVEPQSCPFCEAPVAAHASHTPEAACGTCGAPLCSAQQHAHLEDSRRIFDRLPFSLRVTFVRAGASQQGCKGLSSDLSMGGMRLLTPQRLAVGERLLLVCDFCSAVAIVRHVQANPEDPALSECGLQFVTLHLKRQRGGLLSASA